MFGKQTFDGIVLPDCLLFRYRAPLEEATEMMGRKFVQRWVEGLRVSISQRMRYARPEKISNRMAICGANRTS